MAQLHTTRYIRRGLSYAFTSACAIFAGYLMQAQYWSMRDAFLLLIPPLASLFFFICYANRFHPSESKAAPGTDVQTALQTEALIFTPIIVVLLSSIIIILDRPPSRLVVSYIVYAGLLASYGTFLLRYETEGPLPQVRHELVWPVLLTIGCSLYYGLSFIAFGDDLRPLVPVGLLVLLYAVSQLLKLSKRAFVYGTLSVALAATVVQVMTQRPFYLLPPPFDELLFRMLFCTAAAAYLAVFEAWRITSDIARRQSPRPSLEGSPQPEPALDFSAKASEYSKAVLLALTGSISILPLYFVFSGHGAFFLIAFVVHAFLSFILWYQFGRVQYFRKSGWAITKTVAGLLFLGILVASPRFRDLPTKHFFPRFVSSWQGFSVLITLTALPTFRLLLDLRRVRKKGKHSVFLRLFEKRLNFIRLLSLLSVIAAFVISLLLDSFNDPSPRYTRAELAFLAYSVCVILCLLIEVAVWTLHLPQLTSLVRATVGLLLVVRIFTSLIIGLIVLLPSLTEGIDLISSILSSLPFVLAAAGGFALNDYFDEKKDLINKPYRPVPSGRLKARTVFAMGIILIFASMLATVMKGGSKIETAFYVVAIVGVASYNIFVRYLTLSKAFLTSAVSSLPVLYVVVVLNYPPVFMFVPTASCIFLLGREWLMDIRDAKGDSAEGIATLPIRIGTKKTTRLAIITMAVGVICLLPFIFENATTKNLVLFSCVLASVTLGSFFWGYKNGRYQRPVIWSLYFPMICAILLLVR